MKCLILNILFIIFININFTKARMHQNLELQGKDYLQHHLQQDQNQQHHHHHHHNHQHNHRQHNLSQHHHQQQHTKNLHQQHHVTKFYNRKNNSTINNNRKSLTNTKQNAEPLTRTKSLKLGVVNSQTYDKKYNWKSMAEETTTERSYHNNQHNYGRHVCTKHKTIQVPEVYKELYDKPIQQQFSEPCHGKQICTGVRIVHEKAYRDVIRHRTTNQVVHYCCPGWEKAAYDDNDCSKPICGNCKNGGKCTEPNTCTCLSGFTGKYCENDINECKEEKPCDQYCFNTEGSYYCKCRDGFALHTDKQSCKKLGLETNDASEIGDLNDYLEYDKLNSRLSKLENSMELGQSLMTREVNKNIKTTMENINSFRIRIDSMEHKQQDLAYQIKEKLKDYDIQARKFEHFIDVFHKYRY